MRPPNSITKLTLRASKNMSINNAYFVTYILLFSGQIFPDLSQTSPWLYAEILKFNAWIYPWLEKASF